MWAKYGRIRVKFVLISCVDELLKKEESITEKYRNEGVCEINSTTAT